MPHLRIMVVAGRAISIPRRPRSVPHIESDKRMMAGFSPMALPMILGVRMRSLNPSTAT